MFAITRRAASRTAPRVPTARKVVWSQSPAIKLSLESPFAQASCRTSSPVITEAQQLHQWALDEASSPTGKI